MESVNNGILASHDNWIKRQRIQAIPAETGGKCGCANQLVALEEMKSKHVRQKKRRLICLSVKPTSGLRATERKSGNRNNNQRSP